MSSYYNDNDKHCVAWLKELIASGLIPPGDVDNRSIADVKATDLKGYTQCHFFAGIGGWPYALELAGWHPARPVWSGSCPCQPYSAAGKGLGDADPRNLWPEFYRLIGECHPDAVFGEQVTNAIGHGWLDGIQRDLEAEGYAVGHCVLGAHSVGSPNIRQRLYWVANTNQHGQVGKTHGISGIDREEMGGREFGRASGSIGRMGNSDGAGSQGHRELRECTSKQPIGETGQNFWSAYDLIPCGDGKQRRIEPGTFPLASRVSGRVGLLRGYGNAINPQVAAEFIRAFEEIGANF